MIELRIMHGIVRPWYFRRIFKLNRDIWVQFHRKLIDGYKSMITGHQRGREIKGGGGDG